MTSNDPPAPVPRRRPLGRGPATPRDGEPLAAEETGPQAASADEAAPRDARVAPTGVPGGEGAAQVPAHQTRPEWAAASDAPGHTVARADTPPAAAPVAPDGEDAARGPAAAAVPAGPDTVRPGQGPLVGLEGVQPGSVAASGAPDDRAVRRGRAEPPPIAAPAEQDAARLGLTGPEGAQPEPVAASDASGHTVAPDGTPSAEERARVGGQERGASQGGAQSPVSSAAGAESGAEGAEDAGDGRFKVRLANFEGPFDLLLQLIAKHKLDVTEVALSKVTDEFMAYIRALGPDWDLDETTEFLVVAATLLDLKAARLLPAAEVEDEADLALLEARDLLFARLLQYRAYKQIADIFSRRLDDEARRFPRTVGLEPHHAELLPDVVISIGPEGFARLAVKAMQPKPKPQVYVDHIHTPLVSVQEQAGIVVERLKELGEASFRALVEDTDDTLTVVARFLALLELYREKAVALDQETALGELTVRWTGGDGDAVPAVTDEFDRPPEQPQEERTP